jgi:fibronectin type 3 domain-containing protein
MTFRMHVMIGIVLLCFAGLLTGCNEDSAVAPEETTPAIEAPPAAVSGLRVMLNTNGDVTLRWDASTQPNLRGYNVYRHIVSESAIGILNVSPLTDNRYTDTTTERGQRYEYLVTAVSAKGLESAYAAVSVVTERGNVRDIEMDRDAN